MQNIRILYQISIIITWRAQTGIKSYKNDLSYYTPVTGGGGIDVINEKKKKLLKRGIGGTQ